MPLIQKNDRGTPLHLLGNDKIKKKKILKKRRHPFPQIPRKPSASRERPSLETRDLARILSRIVYMYPINIIIIIFYGHHKIKVKNKLKDQDADPQIEKLNIS